jgi:rplM_bact: ribosomal protein L13
MELRRLRVCLPKNTLGRAALLRLRLFEGAEHNHQAQKPAMIED